MTTDEELILMPVPALCVFLMNLEKEKGSPLSHEEVLAARDNIGCIAVPRSVKQRMDDARGYTDIDPENVWEDWLTFRAWSANQQS